MSIEIESWERITDYISQLKWWSGHMWQWGANRNPWTGYRMCSSPTTAVPPKPQTGGLVKSIFKFQPTDEIVNGAHLRKHWLWCEVMPWTIVRSDVVKFQWGTWDRAQNMCGRRAAWSPWFFYYWQWILWSDVKYFLSSFELPVLLRSLFPLWILNSF